MVTGSRLDTTPITVLSMFMSSFHFAAVFCTFSGLVVSSGARVRRRGVGRAVHRDPGVVIPWKNDKNREK